MPMPELTLKGLSGKDVSLSQYKGKVVLVNFWATWCVPCREEIPWLIGIQQTYSVKGFTVLGLAMDEEGKSVVAPFVAKERFDVNGHQLPMSYPILIGNDAAKEKFGGLLGYPSSVLISRDGKQSGTSPASSLTRKSQRPSNPSSSFSALTGKSWLSQRIAAATICHKK